MKVKEILTKYHKLVPFPWTPRKIKKAGFVPTEFMVRFGKELGQCDDLNSAEAKPILDMLHELKLLGG